MNDKVKFRGETEIPAAVRLYDLFVQIEKEFEILYNENVSLQDRLHECSSNLVTTRSSNPILSSLSGDPIKPLKPYTLKLRCQTNKLKAQTNRIMSNLKNPSSIHCRFIRDYIGHSDGIWDVSVSLNVLGTASADHSAQLYHIDSGKVFCKYVGHEGSVNSLAFHPRNKELILTASGDGTVHLWRSVSNTQGENERDEKENEEDLIYVRKPDLCLKGHQGTVVIAANWFNENQVVSGGWDRSVCLWDSVTGELLQSLFGHDEEITHVSTHPNQRLFVTSSKDSTFRLWDFRESIHSVSVFQGHSDSVNSSTFTKEELIVSASDDRTIKIWDLRNMRTPISVIPMDSPINRLSISSEGLLAIPLDNRHIRLYDLNEQRVSRLPRNPRQSHSRIVTCTAWAEEYLIGTPNLFSSGFDKNTFGWSITSRVQYNRSNIPE